MENASVFAQAVRPAMHFARYALLRDLGEKAIAGKSSWFFYKPRRAVSFQALYFRFAQLRRSVFQRRGPEPAEVK